MNIDYAKQLSHEIEQQIKQQQIKKNMCGVLFEDTTYCGILYQNGISKNLLFENDINTIIRWATPAIRQGQDLEIIPMPCKQ